MKLRAAGIVDGHDLAHLVGDFQILSGPDHKRPSDRTFAAYFMVADGFAIQLRIDPHSQETEAFRASDRPVPANAEYPSRLASVPL